MTATQLYPCFLVGISLEMFYLGGMTFSHVAYIVYLYCIFILYILLMRADIRVMSRAVLIKRVTC